MPNAVRSNCAVVSEKTTNAIVASIHFEFVLIEVSLLDGPRKGLS
jgi:hypothetical protein